MIFCDSAIAAGIAGLTKCYAAKDISPLDTTLRYLARIERYNPLLGAFVDLDRDRALIDAAASTARWVAGVPLSPVDGAPIAIKSNIAVGGLPWTAGIGAFRNRIAERDAACVTTLRQAGAIILGTVNMHEAALGATTDNPWFGRTLNPHDLERTAGGSSGGSAAAVAAGLCAAALGTDTFGSVRIPAAYCGIFGHKPRRNDISTEGIAPLAQMFDHVGVLARSAEDCLVLTEVMTPPATGRIASSPKIAMVGWESMTVGLRTAHRELQQRVGSTSLLILDGYDIPQTLRTALFIAKVELAKSLADLLDGDRAGISIALQAMLDWGAHQPSEKLAAARQIMAMSAAALEDQLAPFDFVVMPAAAAAPNWHELPDRDPATFPLLGSLLGWPTTAFPIGRDYNHMPLSAQVMARSDQAALTAAAKWQAADGPPAAFLD